MCLGENRLNAIGILTAAMLVVGMSVSAQDRDAYIEMYKKAMSQIAISGEVIADDTNQPAVGATVMLCDSAGNVLQTVVAGEEKMRMIEGRKRDIEENKRAGREVTYGGGNIMKIDGRYSFLVARRNSRYIIKASFGEKYDTAYVTMNLSGIGKRETSRSVQTIYLKRRAKQLDE